MSKSILYAGSSATISTTSEGTVIPFTNVVRRYGSNINISGGNPVITGCGYYNGNVNITFTGISAGTITFTVYADGVVVPYANASVSASADTVNSVDIPFVVREKCNCENTITVIASGVAVSVTNAGIVIEKE